MQLNWTTTRMLALAAVLLAQLVPLLQSALLAHSLNQCWEPIGNATEPRWS
ncbi:hypothetical protein ABIF60_001980 [Bradyrhizobium japonicum]